MANTKFTQSSNEVTFTREPQYGPSTRAHKDRGRWGLTRDGESFGQVATTTARRTHDLGWENLLVGTQTATGGTDWLGLKKFYDLVAGSAQSFTYTDEAGAAHAGARFVMPELVEGPNNGVSVLGVKVTIYV